MLGHLQQHAPAKLAELLVAVDGDHGCRGYVSGAALQSKQTSSASCEVLPEE